MRRFRAALAPLLWAQLAMVVVVVTNGVSLMTLQPVIDKVFLSTVDPVTLAVPHTQLLFTVGKARFLVCLTAFFLVSRTIYAVALYLQRFLMMISGEIVVNRMRTDLYERLLSLQPSFFSARRSGELVANLTSDLGVVQTLASTITADLLRRPFEIVCYIGILFAWNPELAFYSFCIAPVIVGIVNFLGKTIRRRAHRMQSKMADLSSALQESVAGIRVIQSFTAESRMAEKFRSAAREYLARSRRAYSMVAASNPATEVVAAVAIGGIILLGGHYVIAGRMSPGQFFTFIAILMATYQPVKTLVNALAEANRAMAGLERIYAVLDTVPTIRSEKRTPARFLDRIAFERVAFAYPDAPDQVILEDIDFEVKRGETVAVVGPSGSGKTTLLSLLPRFHDPIKGRLTLDGVDLRDLDLASLRRLIGMVTQETFLFNDTIAANIAFGKPNATEAEIRAAAEASFIRETIEQMPNGFDTVVGERGVRLSGGEKQRVAIARALLIDPPLLILDEATSSLDSEAEQRVQASVDRLIAGRTTLVIAHRLSTVQHADSIIVMENGRIVETGRHADLLAAQGLYAKLHAIQFKL